MNIKSNLLYGFSEFEKTITQIHGRKIKINRKENAFVFGTVIVNCPILECVLFF